MPCARAWAVSVAMTSSASKPSTWTWVIRNASRTSLTRSTWPTNSLGVLARPALYSAYCSLRKVWRETSKATARWVGASSLRTLMSIEVKPYTPLVLCPVEVEKFSTGRAKKAR